MTDAVALRAPTTAVHAATRVDDWTVGREGTITAADVLIGGDAAFTVASVYAPWDRTPSGGLYADASAHRVLSDLSALTFGAEHRLVVAGDWNVLLGYGEHGDSYYAGRYRSVFDQQVHLVGASSVPEAQVLPGQGGDGGTGLAQQRAQRLAVQVAVAAQADPADRVRS